MWSRGVYYSRLLWWGLLKLNWPRKMRRVLSCWYWLWVKLTKRNLFSKVHRYMGKFIERQMVEKERARKSILGRVRTWRGEELSVSVVGLVDKEKPICRHKSWTQPSTDAANLHQTTLCLEPFEGHCSVPGYPLPRYKYKGKQVHSYSGTGLNANHRLTVWPI